jgi:hypothetical protein
MLYDAASSSSARRVPIPSGIGYRIDSFPANAFVTRELADELRSVLERFALEAGYGTANPVSLFFKPGVVGHHKVGRAADIYGVGGVGLALWKERWNQTMARASQESRPEWRGRIASDERKRNLGWRLYKALQFYGRWAQPYGFPIQLFGPWTRTEGPWIFISDPLLHAHRDHIHVAK